MDNIEEPGPVLMIVDKHNDTEDDSPDMKNPDVLIIDD